MTTDPIGLLFQRGHISGRAMPRLTGISHPEIQSASTPD